MNEEEKNTINGYAVTPTVVDDMIDYKKEYKKMQSRYNKLLDKNKKLEKALVNFALKVLEEKK